ncbi:hypothetical protein AB0D57_07275 [Streptomyces sp. NPDC048275]|uniref:hypothetical protein n=1 Tax=Streptomyces sp. NPDC048275 TaxID=3155629 RepID=UPI00340E147A
MTAHSGPVAPARTGTRSATPGGADGRRSATPVRSAVAEARRSAAERHVEVAPDPAVALPPRRPEQAERTGGTETG